VICDVGDVDVFKTIYLHGAGDAKSWDGLALEPSPEFVKRQISIATPSTPSTPSPNLL